MTRPRGDCFPAATKLATESDTPLTVVHARITPVLGPLTGVTHWHAWCESVEDNMVLGHSQGKRLPMPIPAYYALARVGEHEYHRYTAGEAMGHVWRSGHWGPWEETQ